MLFFPLNLDFILPYLSQENPEPTADWGKCGVPKCSVMRGMHFCQRRYEIIPCRVKPIMILQVVFLRRLFWILMKYAGDFLLRPPAKPPAHQSKESNTCGAQAWHLDSAAGYMIVEARNFGFPTSLVANPAEHEFISWLAPIHPVAYVCHWLYPQTPTYPNYNPCPCCYINVHMLWRGRRAGLDKKFVKALEPSLAHRLQDWQLMTGGV